MKFTYHCCREFIADTKQFGKDIMKLNLFWELFIVVFAAGAYFVGRML